MAEKDRKAGQNGKGSDSRVKDIKKFRANWEEINWSDKGLQGKIRIDKNTNMEFYDVKRT